MVNRRQAWSAKRKGSSRRGNSGAFNRKLWCNKTLEINNGIDMYDYGLAHIDFTLNDFFGGKVLIQGFDEYKVTKCRMFAGLGANTTVHDCNTIEVFAAPDHDGLYATAGRGAVLSSTLAKKHSFRPNDSPLIANFVPRTVINDRQISNQPVTTGAWGVRWHGLNVLAIDFSKTGSASHRKQISITIEITVHLTRPNPNQAAAAVGDPPANGFALVALDNPDAPPSDLGGDIPYLKNQLLTGAFFPVDMLGHNIGNMGSNSDDYTGAKFSRSINYEEL